MYPSSPEQPEAIRPLVMRAVKDQRIDVFLSAVATQCDRLRRNNFSDCDLCRSDHFADGEAAFVAACHACLKHIAACATVPELKANLMARHLISFAQLCAKQPVPLVGDLYHLQALAQAYQSHEITVATILHLVCVRRNERGAITTGCTVGLRLDEQQRLDAVGGDPTVRQSMQSMIRALPALASNSTVARFDYVRNASEILREQTFEDWEVQAVNEPADYILYPGQPEKWPVSIDAFMPETFAVLTDFYADALVHTLVGRLTKAERAQVSEMLRIDDEIADECVDDIYDNFRRAHPEDVFRALWYVQYHRFVGKVL